MKTTFLGDPKCSTVLVITLGMSEDIKVINSSQNQNHHIPPYIRTPNKVAPKQQVSLLLTSLLGARAPAPAEAPAPMLAPASAAAPALASAPAGARAPAAAPSCSSTGPVAAGFQERCGGARPRTPAWHALSGFGAEQLDETKVEAGLKKNPELPGVPAARTRLGRGALALRWASQEAVASR